MTAAVCRVEKVRPLPEEARRHPLATQTGVQAFAALLTADRLWRPLTARQKTVLRTAYDRALAAALAAGDTEIPLPELPDDTHPVTARSLGRRGLVADGRLTGLAVEVCRWAIPFERDWQARRRAVETVTVRGGVL